MDNKSIEEYKKELMRMANTNKQTVSETLLAENDNNIDFSDTSDTSDTSNNNEVMNTTEEDTSQPTELTIENNQDSNETDENYFADFKAQVFTADKAYPVSNATIKIIKDNNLVAFLVTQKDGTTKTIKLASPPSVNSLDPFNKEQSIEYYAQINAEGFIPKDELLVSAVGDTNIILQTNLSPDEQEVL